VVLSVVGDNGVGDSRQGRGELGGKEMGEGGSSRCNCMSVLATVPMPSLDFRSVFSCCSVALSS